MKLGSWLGAALALVLTGCEAEGLAGPVWREVLDTRLHVLLLQGAAWGALGAGVGLAVGIVAFVLLRRRGAYGRGWRFERLLHGATAAVVALGCAAAGGWAGLCQGGLRGGEVVLRESQLATEVLPFAGGAGADLLFLLDRAAREAPEATTTTTTAAVASPLEAFRRGQLEAEVVDLAARVERLGDQALLASLERARAQLPESLRDGASARVVEGALAALLRRLVARELEGQARSLGLDPFLGDVVDGLPALAARSGDPRGATRAELSTHLVQKGLVPAVLHPLRGLARGQQLAALAVLLGFLLVPPLFFLLVERLQARWSARSNPRPGGLLLDAAGSAPAGPNRTEHPGSQ